MCIKTVPHPPYCPDLAPCDFCLFPKLRGCRYETIEEMKEAVTKVIDTLTQEDFDEVFQKLLEQYNKYIAAGGDYFECNKSFMCARGVMVIVEGNWTRRHEFKSWTRLIAFSHSTNTLGKGMNPIILPPAMGK